MCQERFTDCSLGTTPPMAYLDGFGVALPLGRQTARREGTHDRSRTAAHHPGDGLPHLLGPDQIRPPQHGRGYRFGVFGPLPRRQPRSAPPACLCGGDHRGPAPDPDQQVGREGRVHRGVRQRAGPGGPPGHPHDHGKPARAAQQVVFQGQAVLGDGLRPADAGNAAPAELLRSRVRALRIRHGQVLRRGHGT